MFSLIFSQMMIVVLLWWFLCGSTAAAAAIRGQGSVNDVVRCNEKDQYALSMFRQGVEDPSDKLSSWSTEEDCCKWTGVACDNSTGSVTELNLCSCQLRGQIPSAMALLQQLEVLRLSSNNLNGSIPEWMGQYKHLQHLDLANNSFSGPIPAALGNISSLIFLDVSNNQLNGSLPVDLGHLSELEYLSVGYNSLSGNMPEQLFTELSNLQLLLIEESALTFQVGTDWQPPFQLKELRVANCKIGPEFPSWVYTQRSLSYLDLSSSELSFTAHPEFWRFVSQIVSVNLYNNSISGNISIPAINNLAINLNANKLTGELPRLSTGVYFFSVADNSLSGPISPSLCQSMSNDSRLEHLDLSNNLFSGEFPDCWTLVKSLKHLSLGSNKLSGEIPDSIGSLKDLQTLRLHNNSLSGNLPDSLESFAQLWFLDLRFNQFTGNIPSWISRLSIILLLRSNNFTGTIPPQLCQLPNLAVLDLANNRLSGPIPKCLHIEKEVIDTINNDLSEPYFDKEYATYLPETYKEDLDLLVKGSQLKYKKNIMLLRIVDLSSNELSGSTPPELFSLIALQSLNLSHNHLKGLIPSEIGHMRFLESLDLSSNLFTGEIPQSLSNLSFLNHLNLSYNNFKGMIPLSTQLQSFDAFSYIGNPALCGVPLLSNCTQGDSHPIGSKWMEDKDKDDDDFRSSFYIGMGVGFAFAFWLVSGTFFCIRRWRHAYFRILDDLYVFVAIKMTHFLQSC